ncbi:hypothetical protein Desor_2819 [Desulfosporosinus orientis DSM 765]|uniref:DUF3846 domain-containing protein n=1 Tax=Desulfosporosinus orientis (strain ATCC 19365 / DSM 765 / NCIMB 8382 / VKM B-1628 / Singapore I) TaxID=768706 RepID=G7WDN2_DESOD|nr:hypothetical protein [Desulfosporosinus orientis]AET68357.1 hypothetical protein Desor_2819 [Desulfosporosinus orientis DSM 765]
MVKWITVLLVEPGKTPDIRQMPNNLKAFELTVGGYPEIVESIRPGCFIFYNGVQPLPQKSLSRADFEGTFIILRVDPPELVSLTQEDIDILSQAYQ